MQEYKIQLIESIITVLLLIITRKVIQQLIDRAGKKFSYHKSRVTIVKKVVSLVLYFIFLGIFILIWGIAPSQLAGYIASLFTVVGIAFLAQWSIVSNITSTLIIFFNHQVKIGDTIEILDKDYHIEGVIYDIGAFFIILKLNSNEFVSLPSNVFMQKMVKKINN